MAPLVDNEQDEGRDTRGRQGVGDVRQLGARGVATGQLAPRTQSTPEEPGAPSAPSTAAAAAAARAGPARPTARRDDTTTRDEPTRREFATSLHTAEAGTRRGPRAGCLRSACLVFGCVLALSLLTIISVLLPILWVGLLLVALGYIIPRFICNHDDSDEGILHRLKAPVSHVYDACFEPLEEGIPWGRSYLEGLHSLLYKVTAGVVIVIAGVLVGMLILAGILALIAIVVVVLLFLLCLCSGGKKRSR